MKKEAEENFFNLFKEVYSKCKSAVSINLLFISVIFTFISAAMEAISLGLIIPLLEIVLKPAEAFSNFGKIQYIYNLFNIANKQELVLFTAILILAAVLLKNLFGYISDVIRIYVNQNIAHSLRSRIMEQLLQHDFLFFEKNKVGELSYDINLSTQFSMLIERLHSIIYWTATSLSYIILMFYISWQITLLLVFILPPLYFFGRWVKRLIETFSSERVKAESNLAARIYELLSSIHLIKSYGTEEEEAEDFNKLSGKSKATNFRLGRTIGIISRVYEPVIVFAVMLIAGVSYLLFIDFVRGGIAGFMAYFVVLKRFETTFQSIASGLISLTEFEAPMQKILGIFKIEDWMLIKSGNIRFKGLKKEISFKNVYSSYGEEKQHVLKNINLMVKKGSTVALVGHTGSGKSSLVSLIPRIFDYDKGEITIDGIPIKEFDIDSLRHHIGIVSQDSIILNRTVRENICYGIERRISNKELEKATRTADIYDFIQTLPSKFNTVLGEHGVDLSGGQKQRIAIARAIIRNPDILILDEATSALDTDTERKIQHGLYKTLKGKTIFVIAHRLSTVQNADKIIVIENGEIKEQGTFNQLLKMRKRFYHYWHMQREIHHKK